jgi:hypothetical protein
VRRIIGVFAVVVTIRVIRIVHISTARMRVISRGAVVAVIIRIRLRGRLSHSHVLLLLQIAESRRSWKVAAGVVVRRPERIVLVAVRIVATIRASTATATATAATFVRWLLLRRSSTPKRQRLVAKEGRRRLVLGIALLALPSRLLRRPAIRVNALGALVLARPRRLARPQLSAQRLRGRLQRWRRGRIALVAVVVGGIGGVGADRQLLAGVGLARFETLRTTLRT